MPAKWETIIAEGKAKTAPLPPVCPCGSNEILERFQMATVYVPLIMDYRARVVFVKKSKVRYTENIKIKVEFVCKCGKELSQEKVMEVLKHAKWMDK